MKKIKIAAVVLVTLLGFSSYSQASLWSAFLSLFNNNSNVAETENPIMLVPGIFAFTSIAGIDYWFQIPDAIESRGGEVYVASINAFENSAERGEQLIAQMETIIAASNGRIEKFNLVGHSQGGITSRYVMNVRPDLVASVTTMSTPHTGSPLADIVTGVAPEGTLVGVGFDVFANTVGNLINLLSDDPADESDIRAMLSEFTVEGSANFSAQFPAGMPTTPCGTGPAAVNIDGNNIPLYSWGGGSLITSGVDISDALFAVTGLAFNGEPSDGVTGVCSNHFGTIIRDDYAMNHIDINNHVLGIVSLFETNPKTVFVNHARRLARAGL